MTSRTNAHSTILDLRCCHQTNNIIIVFGFTFVPNRSAKTRESNTMAKTSKIAAGCFLLLAGSSAFVPSSQNYQQMSAGKDIVCSGGTTLFAENDNSCDQSDKIGFGGNLMESIRQTAAVSVLALGLTFTTLSNPLPAMATDSGAIVGCLFSKCQLPLAKCIANPKCLANVVCINTCNGRDDEIECQIKCGDLFENEVVGEFNKCVVSDMGCVPQKPDEGLYPVPAPEALVQKFDTKLWNGKWYITSGQNELFDVRFRSSVKMPLLHCNCDIAVVFSILLLYF